MLQTVIISNYKLSSCNKSNFVNLVKEISVNGFISEILLFDKINIITCGWERDITKNFSNEEYFDFKQKLYKLVKESVNLG